MTTTPISPERLREIAAQCDRAHAWGDNNLAGHGALAAIRAIPELLAEVARLKDGCDEAVRQRNAAIAVSEERRAEVARLNATCTGSAQNYCRALDRQRAELEAAQAEVARLQSIGRALELNCCELTEQRDVYRSRSQQLATEVGETKLVIEQQDRDLGRQRVHIAALESGHAEMRRGCEEWRAGCDERDARIDALETALREACGYIDPAYCDDGTTTPTKDRLLAVAGAVESREI